MEDQARREQGKVAAIRRAAIGILEQCPEGIHFAELRRRIAATLPGANKTTVGNVIYDLPNKSESVYKPGKGVFRHIRYQDAGTGESEIVVEPMARGQRHEEAAFYKPFANYLVGELEECTKAISVGGNLFRNKWGTPDVIGIREARRGDIVQFPTEIVSGEIKVDTNSLITAFGQACSYWLFSHKSYIVVPRNAPDDDIARLDALSCIFGIGLILFNPEDPNNPDFRIQARAAKHDPDMFYVNQCMRMIADRLFG